jgi:hypothetical protein
MQRSQCPEEVEEWLPCPVTPGPWSKHIKTTTGTYALLYYSSTPTIAPAHFQEIPGLPPMVFEAVSDVLFVRLRHGQVVDVDDQDVSSAWEIYIYITTTFVTLRGCGSRSNKHIVQTKHSLKGERGGKRCTNLTRIALSRGKTHKIWHVMATFDPKMPIPPPKREIGTM